MTAKHDVVQTIFIYFRFHAIYITACFTLDVNV